MDWIVQTLWGPVRAWQFPHVAHQLDPDHQQSACSPTAWSLQKGGRSALQQSLQSSTLVSGPETATIEAKNHIQYRAHKSSGISTGTPRLICGAHWPYVVNARLIFADLILAIASSAWNWQSSKPHRASGRIALRPARLAGPTISRSCDANVKPAPTCRGLPTRPGRFFSAVGVAWRGFVVRIGN